MFRKFIIAAGAVAALSAAALAPTSASAGWHGHHGWGHGWGYGPRFGFYVGGPTYVNDGCYYTRKPIVNVYGQIVGYRRVLVCG
ncbi:MAG: hypothetical protein JO205_10255 [Pseudolabrys sp.]|nr:hypothetical protein [Pseudolabrys sp.]MBV9261740.1 hypothetical protein [Pseudolabrys sp.]